MTPKDTLPTNALSANRASDQPDWCLSDFHYDLPENLIAQVPLAGRSDSRLMQVDGSSVKHQKVRDLPGILRPGDHLVFNDTRVVPARLYGQKASGGRLELMLERVTSTGSILAKIRASKSPKPGTTLILNSSDSSSANVDALVKARHADLFELEAVSGSNEELALFIESHGEIPLPPYIQRKPDADDAQRYQTVFAEHPGAVAAPTAGLHFDEGLLEALASAGVTHSFITLHVGAGTFQPVRVENPDEHVMHAERVTVASDTIAAIENAQKRRGRIIAVGTTCVRALESAASASGRLAPYSGETRLFLRPGVRFNVVDGIFTNFHLPESTLLMLVAAYAGLNSVLQAYADAVESEYRFFSYGDAMLVWPQPGVRA